LLINFDKSIFERSGPSDGFGLVRKRTVFGFGELCIDDVDGFEDDGGDVVVVVVVVDGVDFTTVAALVLVLLVVEFVVDVVVAVVVVVGAEDVSTRTGVR
jgi:alkanesulfonate monooxygenase SsuD/methylene tetrahydromethanopterin reductase-like flavin-dependent oxidoreductase (luciferase family)